MIEIDNDALKSKGLVLTEGSWCLLEGEARIEKRPYEKPHIRAAGMTSEAKNAATATGEKSKEKVGSDMGSSDKRTEILAVLEHMSNLAYQHGLILRSIDKALYGIQARIDFMVTLEGSPMQQATAAAQAQAPGTSTYPPSSTAPIVPQSATPAAAESSKVQAEPKVDSAKVVHTERKEAEVVPAQTADADDDEDDEDPEEAPEDEEIIGEYENPGDSSEEDTTANGGDESDELRFDLIPPL